MRAALIKKTEGKHSGLLNHPTTESSRRAEHGLGASPGLPLFLQTKLAVSQPDDPYEQEADRVADQIMRMPTPLVQRQCAACMSGGPRCLACEDESVTMSRQANGVAGGNVPASVHSVLRSPGQPLAESARAFFEPRFGRDLSQVRVHTDGAAQHSAQGVNAMAYTVGEDIFFAEGRYAPHTASGRHLLAHELAHTVQQGNAKASRVQRSLLPGGSGDWHEVVQALTVIIAGLDLAAIATQVAPIAIREAGAYTTAGGDYGPQNALRHSIFAGLLDSWGWRAAIAELAAGVFFPLLPQLKPYLLLFGSTMALRVRLVLWAHEKFADDGCGNFGTGTVDSECDQLNNEVGLGIGGPFTSDADVIRAAKVALDGGRLWMTPGPTDLSTIVSTAGWRTSPWMAGGPQQPDCRYVTKK